MTQQYKVIGHPISHSLSPMIHSHWMAQHGIDATYSAQDVLPEELEVFLSHAPATGLHGLNVTLPHKEETLRIATSSSDTAKRIGAANTLVLRDNAQWHAENTDAPGFALTLSQNGLDVSGVSVLLLGAGGSARAVALALSRAGAKLTICNRTVARAEKLVADLGITARIVGPGAIVEEVHSAQLVVNTVSLGLAESMITFPEGNSRIFYDISYGSAVAPMFAKARTAGWQTMDGLGMLVAQAAYSFEHWFGIRPETNAVLKKCRSIVEGRA